MGQHGDKFTVTLNHDNYIDIACSPVMRYLIIWVKSGPYSERLQTSEVMWVKLDSRLLAHTIIQSVHSKSTSLYIENQWRAYTHLVQHYLRLSSLPSWFCTTRVQEWIDILADPNLRIIHRQTCLKHQSLWFIRKIFPLHPDLFHIIFHLFIVCSLKENLTESPSGQRGFLRVNTEHIIVCTVIYCSIALNFHN